MIEVTFIRHGITPWNQEFRYQGWTDIPLAPEGLAEAEALRGMLVNESIDAIWSSDLTRAKTTAELVFPHQQIITHTGLREIKLGDWEGSTYSECIADDAEAFSRWLNDPSSADPPNGEALNVFEARIYDTLDGILAESDVSNHSRIAIVTHGGVIRAILRKIHHTPPHEAYQVRIPQCQAIRTTYTMDDNQLLATTSFSGA